MQKKDKQKVLDEVWTEDRVKAFFDLTVPEGINPDFYILHSAYKNMRMENFSDFVTLFSQQKRDIHATNQEGKTLLDIIKAHTKSQAYVNILEKNTTR